MEELQYLPAIVSLSMLVVGVIFLAFVFGFLIGRWQERDQHWWLYKMLWSKEAAIVDLEQRLQMTPDEGNI